jgi:hypothetical protein
VVKAIIGFLVSCFNHHFTWRKLYRARHYSKKNPVIHRDPEAYLDNDTIMVFHYAWFEKDGYRVQLLFHPCDSKMRNASDVDMDPCLKLVAAISSNAARRDKDKSGGKEFKADS